MMRQWHVLLLFLALLGVGLPLDHGARAEALPADSGATAGDQVARATLKNGLRVVVIRNALAPLVATYVNYLVGSNEAPPRFPGMAHAQEHMMFRGSPGLSADALGAVTAALGDMFDADTQQTVTQYFSLVPAEDLDVVLRLEALRMRGVVDSEEAWAKERGAIEQEVAQDLSDPLYVFYTKLLERAFKGTPLAQDALGTRASFERTTAAMLHQFYDAWYAPNNAILVIVGDVEPRTVLARAGELFGDIAAKQLPSRPTVRLRALEPETLNLRTDLPYDQVAIAFRLPGTDSVDYAAAEVLTDVLNSERGALYGLVAAGEALDMDVSLDAFPEASLGVVMAALPRGGDGGALLAKIRDVLAAEVRHGLEPDLVEAARRSELADAEFQKNSISDLAAAWSQALAIERRESPTDLLRQIEKLSVREIDRVATTYLDLNHAIDAVLKSQGSAGEPAPLSPARHREEMLALPKPKAEPLPAWAKGVAERLTIPTSSIKPTADTLANGLRLIVQPETVSDTVTVVGRIRHNPQVEEPPGQEGVSKVLDALFSFGTTSLDPLAYQKALDDIAADASTGADFSLDVPSRHFDRGMELLADNLLHPALPQEDFTTVRGQVAAIVAGELDSPDELATRKLHAGLFPKDDPTLRRATPASVSALTLSDVRAYYDKTFRPDLATVVIVGKIEPEKARAAIERYFGGWQAKERKPDTDLPAVLPNAASEALVPDPQRVQASVVLAETVGLTRSNPDYYALTLGNHVLGGGNYATRLYRDLRDETGLVYSVASTLEAGRTRTIFQVEFGCDPANVSRARAIIAREIEDMRTELLPDDELHRAKALLLLPEHACGSGHRDDR
jgi:zinc protease